MMIRTRSPYPAMRFSANPQAEALKQAREKKLELERYQRQVDHQVTMLRSHTDEGLVEAMLYKPATAVDTEAFMTILKEREKTPTSSDTQETPPYPKRFLLLLRSKLESDLDREQKRDHIPQPVLNWLIARMAKQTFDARDLDHYTPNLFPPEIETKFLDGLLTKAVEDYQNLNRKPAPKTKPPMLIQSIPLMVDLLDYVLTQNYKKENYAFDKGLSGRLEDLVKTGAPPFALAANQQKAFTPNQTAECIISQFEKRGYFQEDAIKLLPEGLFKQLMKHYT